MQLFEMQGLLAGKCLPGDMKVNESLAEYLLRQLNQRDELARQVSALQLSQDNIINALGIKGDEPVSKVVIEYVHGLAAENVALKELIEQHAAGFSVCESCSHEEPCETDDIVALYRSMETPATDAFTAELRAQGVDEFLNDEFVQEVAMCLADFNGETEETVNTVVWSGMPPEPEGNVWELEYVSRASFLARKLKDFAANLRAGRK